MKLIKKNLLTIFASIFFALSFNNAVLCMDDVDVDETAETTFTENLKTFRRQIFNDLIEPIYYPTGNLNKTKCDSAFSTSESATNTLLAAYQAEINKYTSIDRVRVKTEVLNKIKAAIRVLFKYTKDQYKTAYNIEEININNNDPVSKFLKYLYDLETTETEIKTHITDTIINGAKGLNNKLNGTDEEETPTAREEIPTFDAGEEHEGSFGSGYMPPPPSGGSAPHVSSETTQIYVGEGGRLDILATGPTTTIVPGKGTTPQYLPLPASIQISTEDTGMSGTTRIILYTITDAGIIFFIKMFAPEGMDSTFFDASLTSIVRHLGTLGISAAVVEAGNGISGGLKRFGSWVWSCFTKNKND
jgi:hypothetical protein